MSASEDEFDKKLEKVVGNVVGVIMFFAFAILMLTQQENAQYVEKNITRTVTLAPGEPFVGIADNITYTGINNQTATFSIYQHSTRQEPRNITYKLNKTFTLDVTNNDKAELVPIKLRFIKRDDDTLTFEQTTREDVDKKTGKVRYPIKGVDTE